MKEHDYIQIKKVGIDGVHLIKEGNAATVCHLIVDENWVRLTKEGHHQLVDRQICQAITKLKPAKRHRRRKPEQERLFA